MVGPWEGSNNGGCLCEFVQRSEAMSPFLVNALVAINGLFCASISFEKLTVPIVRVFN